MDIMDWQESREAGVLAAVATADLDALRRYSVLPGGYGSDAVRRRAWAHLLHAERVPAEPVLGEHPDESQVLLDTKRSFVYYPKVSSEDKQRLQADLQRLIVTVLRAHPKLSYFQGYHDILSVFYLTFDDNWPTLVSCCEAVSLLRVRDGMGKGLQPLMGLLRILKRVLRAADPELSAFSEQISPVPTLPFFALSWILCLFSHDIDTLAPIQRIFDYLLARNPIAAIYLAVAMLVSKKQRLFELAKGLDEDPTSLHPYFARLPPLVADTPLSPPPISHPLSLDEIHELKPDFNPYDPLYLSTLFQAADSLMAEFPPEHPSIRLSEIMGPDSMVRTYDTEDIATAEEFIHSDSILADAPESDDEAEPQPASRSQPSRSTAVAVSIVLISIGVALYTQPRARAELHRLSDAVRVVVHSFR